jgi:hypothetical protein
MGVAIKPISAPAVVAKQVDAPDLGSGGEEALESCPPCRFKPGLPHAFLIIRWPSCESGFTGRLPFAYRLTVHEPLAFGALDGFDSTLAIGFLPMIPPE